MSKRQLHEKPTIDESQMGRHLHETEVARIKRCILARLKKHGGATYVTLSNSIPGFEQSNSDGKTISIRKNLVLWSDMSMDACLAMQELQNEMKSVPTVTSILDYLMDDRILPLPVVNKNLAPNTPHWIPVVWSLAEREP